MNNQDRPGEKLQGRSYAHTVVLHYMSGWAMQPEPRQYDFRVIGHYAGAQPHHGNGKYQHFVVEYIEVPTLPYMTKEELALLLTILRRELGQLTGVEVLTLRRDLLLEVGKKP